MSPAPAGQPPLAPRLRDVQVGIRAELEVSRHIFDGDASYVVRDPLSFQSHWLSVDNYLVFAALRSDTTLGKTFEALKARGVLGPDQEEDFYRFIISLQDGGLLSLPVSDGKALYNKLLKKREAAKQGRLFKLLFLKIPVAFPDQFLARTIRYTQPLFTRTAFCLWLLAMIGGIGLVASRWHEFVDPLGSMLALNSLPLVWALLVGLKACHEFGHAYACKRFGGTVPEMGVYLVMLTPCAYVDASSSWGFPNRAHRIVVTLAGMYVESILAVAALVIWSLTGPGVVHSAAQYAVALSTVVTIGFNINPLMKYDGYFLLTDILNVPNLSQQAQTQIQGVLKRVLFGIRTAPHANRFSRWMLLTYGALAGLYKVGVTLGMATVIAWKIPLVGMGMAVFYMGNTLLGTIKRVAGYVWTSDEVGPVRRRAKLVTCALATCAALVMFAIPMPGRVQAVGVVSREDNHVVRAGTSGFIGHTAVKEGQHVALDEAVCQLDNPHMRAMIAQKEAEIRRLTARMQNQLPIDAVAAQATDALRQQAIRELTRLAAEAQSLRVLCGADGEVVELAAARDEGRFVRKGEPLARISHGPWVMRASATADTLTSGDPHIGDQLEVRLMGQPERPYSARITRVASVGSRRISSPAVTQLGGGNIAVRPGSMQSVEPYFEITLALDDADPARLHDGMTAMVNFQPRLAPMGWHLYRRGLRFFQAWRSAG